jgi:polyhydroxyalkanoate synthase subunit PhaE
MPEETKQNKESEPVFLSWIQSATDFWSNWAKTIPTSPGGGQQYQAAANNRFLEQWQTNLNIIKTFSQTMIQPESTASAFNSINVIPDMILKMSKSSWEAFFQMQQQFLEKAGKIGRRTEADNFDNPDLEAIKAFTDIYKKELQPYFHLPQLGLTRYSQERFNELLDKQNLFETTLAEFLSIISQPLEKSSQALLEKLNSMAGEGMLPKEAKETYSMWVKILEGNYMNLFRTHDYASAMHNTLNKLEDFILAKNNALQDFLQFLPVPTNKEMDELYKEFNILKKRVKELEEKSKSS